MNAPAEVGDLQFAIQAKKEVLRFDIAMDDVLAVEVRKCIGHLVDVLENR